MSKTETAQPQWAIDLAARLDRIERNASPKLESELRRAAWDAQWEKTKAIASIPDDDERAAALLGLDAVEQRLVWQKMPSPEVALATLRACTPVDRIRALANCPEGLQLEMSIAQLPPPQRVRLRLADRSGAWSSPPQKGARRGEDYDGLRLVGAAYFGTSGGVVEKIVLVTTFVRMREIDQAFDLAITAGVVLVEEVSEAQSKALLRQEILSLQPDQRPGLNL